MLNVFVGALAAAASLGALAAIAVGALAPAGVAAPLVWLVEGAVWLMARGTDPFGGAGLSSIRPAEYAGAAASVYALYYLPLGALVRSLARWRPLELPPDAGAREVDESDDHASEGKRGGTTNAYGAATPAARDKAGRARPRLLGRVGETIGRLLAALGSVRAAWASCVLASFVIVAHPLSAPEVPGRLRVDFLDVGQGDAALLTLPDGTTVLVDAGGRPRFGSRALGATVPVAVDYSGLADEAEQFERDSRGVGERVVSEFLWRRGLDRVDYLLATHAHADHVQGLGDVARSFRARAALVGRAQPGETEFAEFAAALRRAEVPLQLNGRGDVMRATGASLEVLWPPRADGEAAGPPSARSASGNDDSVVLRVRFGRRCFMLTGDIERRAEEAIVAAGDDLRCDVVKVAHHGSKSSSTQEFVSAARASFAVVPAGLDSPFGHPDPQVVARWRAAGADVLQTGRRGTISFTTDGESLTVETFVRERGAGDRGG